MPTSLLLLLGGFLLVAPRWASAARSSVDKPETYSGLELQFEGEQEAGKPGRKQMSRKKTGKKKGRKAGGGKEEYYEVAPERQLPPPLLPRVSLAQVSAHKRDVAGIRQQAVSLGSFPPSLASEVASVTSAVDFKFLARNQRATEPHAYSTCGCAKLQDFHPECMLPCGFMVTTLSQRVSLVAMHTCSLGPDVDSEEGTVPFTELDVALAGDMEAHRIRLERGKLGLAVEVKQGGPLFRADASEKIMSEDFLVAGAGPTRLAALKVTVPKQHDELPPSPIYRPTWYLNQLKNLYRYAIDHDEVLQGELALAHLLGLCNKDLSKGEVTIEFTWRTQLSKDLQKLGFSLRDLAEVTAVNGAGMAALSQFQDSAQAMAAALERSTLAIDPGEALALGARPRSTGNRVRELFLDYESKKAKALDWFDRALAIVKLVEDNSETALGVWDSQRGLLPARLPLWTPSQLHVPRRVKEEMLGLQFRLKAVSGTLESAVRRATRFLQPGQPPEEVENCDLPVILGGSAAERTDEEHEEFLRVFVRLDVVEMQAAGLELSQVTTSLQAAEEAGVANLNFQISEDWGSMLETQRVLRKRLPYPPQIIHIDEYPAEKVMWARRWAQLKDVLPFSSWPRDTAEAPMVKPRICESEWYAGGEVAKFPELHIPLYGKVGGHPIQHTFMIFADQSEGCEGLLADLYGLHARLTPRTAPRFEASKPVDKTAWELYSKRLERAGQLGCQGMVSYGQVAHLNKLFSQHMGKLKSLEVDIVYNATTSRHVVFSLESQTANKRKSKRKGPTKIKQGIRKTIVDWVLHCITKYASRSGGFLWEAVRKSLLRTKPRIDPFELSDAYWRQLQDLQPPVISPYSDALCHRDQKPDEEDIPCDDWVPTIGDGYWQHAEVTDSSLDHVLEGVELVRKAADPGAWRYLAQTSATFAAVGFDAPGVLDNREWTCERTIATCNVHPTCGRLAAQMLAFPWQGTKKYASDKTAKVTTWLYQRRGAFDTDGYHSYCHSSGSGYCWSYTYCLEEMLKWLCSQPETSSQCCPGPEVQQACKGNVNGRDCVVCEAAPQGEEARKLEDLAPKPIPEQTMEWLRPSEEDEKMMEAEEEKERAAGRCEVCQELKALRKPKEKTDALWWMLVEVTDTCQENILFCGEMCGRYDPAKDEGKFKKPDELDDCEGWTARCKEKCPDA